jgi:TolB-like protein/class 3 adenylate cyclase/Tfp pilus assembly protein PilF
MPQTRQLAAIMFTDIVGYTALMGEDEQKAFEILQKNRNLQKPIVEELGGKWIKELGDGVMASFTTVSDAVNAAIKIQQKCNEIKEFQLRIGIHHGEIVFDGDDVFGDAVNIASRIQAIAPVGGIWISESVHQNVVNKRDISTRFVIAEKLKNIAEPVRIYEIILDKDNDLTSQKSSVQKKFTDTIRKTSVHPVFLLVAISIIILGLVYFLSNRKGIFANASIESIAVMPFVNESGIADMEYLSDGMTETLINSLSKLKNLSVKARSSVFRYKGKEINPKKIGDELAVEAILNGRIAKRDGNILLNLELVDVSTGNQIWGENYNRKTTDLVALQSEIASDVSHKLNSRLSGAEEKILFKNYTQNPEAYKLYLQGRYHWNRRRAESLRKAVEYFKQAIDKDPGYALAYASLAECYALFGEYNVEPPKESAPKGKAAALKALEIDPDLAEGYTALAYIETDYEWNFQAAEKDYLRAIELNPKYATARQWYGEYLTQMGRFNEAAAQIRQAQEFDPLSPVINQQMVLVLIHKGEYDEAIKMSRKTLELDPNYPTAYEYIGYAYEAKKIYKEAVAAYLKAYAVAGENQHTIAALEQAYNKGGWKGYLQKSLELVKEKYMQGTTNAGSVALHYAILGNKEEALKWLELSYQNREEHMVWLKVEIAFGYENLRSDLHFHDLLRRVGFPQ